MVTNHFGNRHFMQPMRRLEALSFFFFLLGFVGAGFFWRSVPNVFPICSQQAPILFPKMFPIALYFLSHIVWPWFNFHIIYITCKGEGRWRSRDT
jgi:hypothetical protein